MAFISRHLAKITPYGVNSKVSNVVRSHHSVPNPSCERDMQREIVGREETYLIKTPSRDAVSRRSLKKSHERGTTERERDVQRSLSVTVLRPSIRAFRYPESAIRFRNCSYHPAKTHDQSIGGISQRKRRRDEEETR